MSDPVAGSGRQPFYICFTAQTRLPLAVWGAVDGSVTITVTDSGHTNRLPVSSEPILGVGFLGAGAALVVFDRAGTLRCFDVRSDVAEPVWSLQFDLGPSVAGARPRWTELEHARTFAPFRPVMISSSVAGDVLAVAGDRTAVVDISSVPTVRLVHPEPALVSPDGGRLAVPGHESAFGDRESFLDLLEYDADFGFRPAALLGERLMESDLRPLAWGPHGNAVACHGLDAGGWKNRETVGCVVVLRLVGRHGWEYATGSQSSAAFIGLSFDGDPGVGRQLAVDTAGQVHLLGSESGGRIAVVEGAPCGVALVEDGRAWLVGCSTGGLLRVSTQTRAEIGGNDVSWVREPGAE